MGINISHMNMENVGGHDQSQVKIKFKKFKKLSPFRKDIPKSHNDDTSEEGMNSVCCRVNLNLISTKTMTKLGRSMLVCAAEQYFEPL